MDSMTPSKPLCLRDDAERVLRALRDAGHVAYFAGGCVRDLLLGLSPADWDIATDAPPDRVRSLFRRTQSVGAMFGVILVREGRSTVEVATFRTDGAYADGRRPESVVFGDPLSDAQRRDFTVNGLFLDPLEDRVIDHVGGQGDLAARVLRAIGDPDARFAEDHLRLLRAVRFAARFGFTYDPATLSAIRRHAPKLARIAPERIADELRRMLLLPGVRQRAFGDLWDTTLAGVVFRHLPEKPTAPSLGASLFLSLPADEPIPFGLAIAAAALDVRRLGREGGDVRLLLEPHEIRRIDRAMRQTLRYSNDESDALVGSLDLGLLLQDALPSVAMLRRFLARAHAPAARMMLRALASVGQQAARIAWLEPTLERLARLEIGPDPLVSGDDLIAAGLSPGRQFKRILDEVYDAQLEDRVQTREQAMQLALSLASSPSS
jgi:poly(A) polymerase